MSFMLLGILNSQAAGGGGGAFDLLETTTLTTTASSVTFSGLDTLAAGYKHLQIRMVARSDNAAVQDNNWLEFNGDTTSSNYKYHALVGDGSSVSSFGGSPLFLNEVTAASEATGNFAAKVIDILDFSSASKNTTTKTLMGKTGTAGQRAALSSGLWIDTTAVTSIRTYLSNGSFIAGSRFSLIGIK
jgi:hypothetical protein